MADNEELYPPSPQDISFTAADLSSFLSSDSDKYKHAWLSTKLTAGGNIIGYPGEVTHPTS